MAETVLVTGGAGYVGAHAAKALWQRGYRPVTYDNLARGHRWAVQWGPLEIGDIADRPRLESVLAAYAPVAVLHFAALAYVGESVAQPAAYYETNVAGTLALLGAMRSTGVDQIIFSSTCATYGYPSTLPIDEDHPKAPINPYGASKAMVERILADFGAAYGLRSIALRYFNAAGADPAGEIGEAHDPETHAIPLLLATAYGDRPAFSVFGTDYDTRDGTCVRDFIHVTDLAEAHVLALERLRAGGASRAYNLGNGTGFSLYELAGAIEAQLGRRPRLAEEARRPGDPAMLIADAQRARGELGWSPERSDLATIIATAAAWYAKLREG